MVPPGDLTPANGGHYKVFTPYWRAWITASFLTRNLNINWRHGYRHFGQLLADGDVANNAGNWQWVAGSGNNTRPNRVMNPLRQAQRFDPAGDYVRRYVPELAARSKKSIHTPDSPYWPGP